MFGGSYKNTGTVSVDTVPVVNSITFKLSVWLPATFGCPGAIFPLENRYAA